MRSLAAFGAVRTIGTVLPSEALSRAVDLGMPGQSVQNYQLTPGMAINSAVARAWEAALGAHRAWTTVLRDMGRLYYAVPGRGDAAAVTHRGCATRDSNAGASSSPAYCLTIRRALHRGAHDRIDWRTTCSTCPR